MVGVGEVIERDEGELESVGVGLVSEGGKVGVVSKAGKLRFVQSGNWIDADEISYIDIRG